ncbi:flagellar motor switch protein FliM [Tissierella praeacuta]|uniref:Flagellar motor switch protein FliM n=1 Tax=Tissierella praeacuta DSM 18095 TaxID=1123404 RepID=A0A1M4SLS9_9FIRM|nr:flagellar motor switch protein FliM [Tissierella praeacuta]TCU70580.1 flagellar motor switch protein FliM [Tissierella praeacuta]SHE32937.1 flagellar motor switch protein FliM [Tissierella praeacuta DSM 18095]SUP01535.1 Flagellar motor switch protein FliM [Tissierella praeacuta]
MSEVMSQSEIDALLNALSSGEVDVEEIQEVDNSKKIKKYDFRNPQKISKEQLRTLEVIHENFARHMQTFLTGYLRAPAKINILTVDQFAYSEFSNALSNPAFLTIIDFNPLNGQILIDISPNIIYTIIDRLLGGDGNDKQEIRAFTEIELSLLKNMMQKIAGDIKEAWSNVIELKPTLEKIETNPQFAQIVPPNETIALITMNIEIGPIEGMMNVCIPYILLEPILDKLNTKFWFTTSTKEHSNEELKAIKERMLQTIVPLVAELGTTKVSIRDILNLQVGDVIKLENSESNMAPIRIGSNVKFKGEIGVINKKMAIKIVEVLKEGEIINDK